MKRKSLGIFGKVFLYTTFILIVVIGVSALFFSNQISVAISMSQQQQLTSIFEPLRYELEGKTEEEAIATAEAFHEKNSYFEFCLRIRDGQILYATPNYESDFQVLPPRDPSTTPPYSLKGSFMAKESFPGTPSATEGSGISGNPFTGRNFQMVMNTTSGIAIFISTNPSNMGAYNEIMQRTTLALLLLLLVGTICAIFFARSIAHPVKSLAKDTAKMASLELVSAPVLRSDEIGQMANDVYRMYERLKETILELEREIQKQREMEESQRYFFAAASHELKTPLAATTALLEGVLEGVIPGKEHPETLRTCLRLANEQASLVSEILEIVKLTDHKISLNMQQVNLAALAETVLTSHAALAETHNQKIVTEIDGSLRVKIDEPLFRRAFSNIVANAIQNTPEGGNISIVGAEQGENTVRVSVFNEGSPIPEETLSKLFEPFYHTDEARSKGLKRSGLGLALVSKALSQMSIEYSLENVEGGIVFTMNLPQ